MILAPKILKILSNLISVFMPKENNWPIEWRINSTEEVKNKKNNNR